MLTEILLGVTDSELESIAKDVYRKAKQNAAKGSTWSKLIYPYHYAYFYSNHSISVETFKRVVHLFSKSELIYKVFEIICRNFIFIWAYLFKIMSQNRSFNFICHLTFPSVLFLKVNFIEII